MLDVPNPAGMGHNDRPEEIDDGGCRKAARERIRASCGIRKDESLYIPRQEARYRSRESGARIDQMDRKEGRSRDRYDDHHEHSGDQAWYLF